jgi:DNA-binding GntR family transcriptional regulator
MVGMAKSVDKAYQTVRERILSGGYLPAARITEQEIAAAAGVSRTPVREALRRLEAEGLVQFVANQGAVVTQWSDADRDDVFELRALLESYGAARAAQRVSPEALDELRSLARLQYDESVKRKGGYLERIGLLNTRFHRHLHASAASPRLLTALASLIEAPMMMRTFERYAPDDLVRSASHHLELVQALESRDSEWAASVMRSHIYSARGALRARG